MKNKIKNILLITIGVILGLTVGVTAATTIASTSVTYGNSTVKSALDELMDIANNMVPIDPDTFQTNSAKTVYASSKGVCINRNYKLNCFKINNWDVEKEHIQEVFSDVSCSVFSSGVNCDASDLGCSVGSDGLVGCYDYADGSYCEVYPDGTVECY